jgi:hypothetical protein
MMTYLILYALKTIWLAVWLFGAMETVLGGVFKTNSPF